MVLDDFLLIIFEHFCVDLANIRYLRKDDVELLDFFSLGYGDKLGMQIVQKCLGCLLFRDRLAS